MVRSSSCCGGETHHVLRVREMVSREVYFLEKFGSIPTPAT